VVAARSEALCDVLRRPRAVEIEVVEAVPAPIATARKPPPPSTPARPRPSRADSAIAVALDGITVDGRLDDWPKAIARHPIRRRLVGVPEYDPTAKGPGGDPEAPFQVGFDRTSGRIYLAVTVPDDDLVTDGGDPWHTDAVEVYVDGLFSDRSIADDTRVASLMPVVQYAAVPGPVVAYGDHRGSNPSLVYRTLSDSTTSMAYRREEDVTTYEWAIQAFDRYPDRPSRLGPGRRIGFDVVVVDKDRGRKKPIWHHWGPAATRFKGFDAGSLGELILDDGP